jgi:SAM-dependent methyltransferase
MGRWSRLVAQHFIPWTQVPPGADWLDVGCGTGSLLDTIAQAAAPRRLAGVDPSDRFLAVAASRLPDGVQLEVADAEHLPFGPGEFDAVVSGLVLNFIGDAPAAVRGMRDVTRPGGVVAAYVWDYAEGMEFLRHFWDAAIEVDPAAHDLDEGHRFPICRPDPLRHLFVDAGLSGVEVRSVDVSTVFAGFDDYWEPFLAGQGPAPGFVAALAGEQRVALRDLLSARLPVEPDGSIPLRARAWAVRGSLDPAG